MGSGVKYSKMTREMVHSHFADHVDWVLKNEVKPKPYLHPEAAHNAIDDFYTICITRLRMRVPSFMLRDEADHFCDIELKWLFIQHTPHGFLNNESFEEYKEYIGAQLFAERISKQ